MELHSQKKQIQVNERIVADLMSANTKRKTSFPLFRVDADPQHVLDVLCYYYAEEVKSRMRGLIFDANTRTVLVKVAECLTNPGYRFGIMMCGNCGNGKTTTMNAIRAALRYLNDVDKAFEFLRDPDTKRIPRIELDVYDAKSLLSKSKKPENFEAIKKLFLLGIDDLGKEAAEVMDFGTVKTPVIDLIEYRYNRMLFTVVTSNLTWKELEEKYNKRIIDRFWEMFHVIAFSDVSYRRLS